MTCVQENRMLAVLRLACLPLVIGCLAWCSACGPRSQDVEADPASVSAKPAATDAEVDRNEAKPKFVSSESCANCHAEQFDSWHASFHRTMTQVASPQTVKADFDNVRLEGRGYEYHLERDDDKFFVDMVAPEWESQMVAGGLDPTKATFPPRAKREIKQITGSHHMQTFWVEGKDGLRNFPWFFLLPDQQWISREDTLLRPPDADPLLPVWDVNCIKCHAVGGVPGFDQTTSKFHSSTAELGISCEACHGPAEHHVQFHESRVAGPDNPGLSEGVALAAEDARLVNPADSDGATSSQICAQCHSSNRIHDMNDWLQHGSRFRVGDDFNDHFVPLRHSESQFEDDRYHQEGFWGDGTNRVAGDEYLAHVESACFQQGGLSCLSCHSMHSYKSADDQLRADTSNDENCFQCHQTYRDRIEEHTHHRVASSGSRCANCHMPHTTYGLLKGIRSHRIDSPSATKTLETGRPNACNLCHLDKTLSWAGETLTKWYGHSRESMPEKHQRVSAAVLDLLEGDAVRRALAAWHMQWTPALETSGNDWQAAFLAHSLQDPYAVVRIIAARSLKTLPGFSDFETVYRLSAQQQTTASESAFERWQRQYAPAVQRPALLLDAQGQLDQSRFEEIVKGRDDRSIEIPE